MNAAVQTSWVPDPGTAGRLSRAAGRLRALIRRPRHEILAAINQGVLAGLPSAARPAPDLLSAYGQLLTRQGPGT